VSSILSIFSENIAFISTIWWGLIITVDNIIDTKMFMRYPIVIPAKAEIQKMNDSRKATGSRIKCGMTWKSLYGINKTT
jgi:hypothetical protein